MNHVYSAIDIGSNAIRMLIAQGQSQGFIEIKKFRSPVRIGKDVFETGYISEATFKKAIETFKQFAHLNEAYGVQQYRAVATSAVREAKNRNEFIEKVYSASKIQIDIIDGIEEAKLVFKAVQHEVDMHRKSALLIDIGGGSVEVTFCENGHIRNTRSFPMGTVRILNLLKKRNLNESHLKILIGDFMPQLSEFIEASLPGTPLHFSAGTGGNFECMAKLKLELLDKTPNNYVTLSELSEVSEILRKCSIKDRIEKLNLRPDRADVILPAIYITKAILRQACIEKIQIPCVGVREGILWSLVL